MFDRPGSGRLTVASLIGAALRHARWRDLTQSEQEEAVAEIRSITADRGLLAEAAGLMRGFGAGTIFEAHDECAARLLIAAGAEESAIGGWAAEGRRRLERSRLPVPQHGWRG